MSLTVREIHRYPVKSMLGERLEAVELDDRGLVGDRWWAVRDGSGRFASGKNSRRFHRMDPVFGCSASMDESGTMVALPDGTSLLASDPRLNERLSELFGESVELVREGETVRPGLGVVEHYDAAPVSLIGTATLAAAAELVGDDEPLDPRRFRANLVVETNEPYAEDGWLGRTLEMGGVRLYVTEQIERCRTVDVQQGDVPRHGRVLKALGEQRDLLLAVYAEPIVTGRIRIGDTVTVR
ncbi:MOSC domain-containing protein [Segeticoccus rhizosphaerae]|uniref:MOSC domain-containing protein n=1 Tax=Segeticoccus rhizosphaerae TaxID=1104777 RepID=UPI0012647D7B|nr:MOSC N-terminal beta barrel domain-containing protein [Segeticoccus rhizosphaerae]